MKVKIGQWARRIYAKKSYATTYYHLVESTTESGIFTRCGRYLRYVTRTEVPNQFEVMDERPTITIRCMTCTTREERKTLSQHSSGHLRRVGGTWQLG